MYLSVDINNFGPFYAHVWGTVGDWVIILVTSVTAWYLYRTLRSQLDVQKFQHHATSIENNRYINQLDIKFKIDLKTITQRFENQNVIVRIVLEMRLLNSDCFKYNITYHSQELLKVLFPIEQSFEKLYQNSKGDIVIELTGERIKFETIGFNFNIKKAFLDPVGNNYNQLFDLKATLGTVTINGDISPGVEPVI